MSANDIDKEMGGNCGNTQESEAIVAPILRCAVKHSRHDT